MISIISFLFKVIFQILWFPIELFFKILKLVSKIFLSLLSILYDVIKHVILGGLFILFFGFPIIGFLLYIVYTFVL